MVNLKSKREINLMQEAGHIVALAHQALVSFIKPGISTLEIDQLVEEIIINNNAKPSFKGYDGFPNATCISVNDTVVHGIPSNQLLKEGDIVSVDIGVYLNGYHADSAWTYPVGEISDELKQLLEVTKQALENGINAAQANAKVNDISKAIEDTIRPYKYGIVEELTGHGVGQQLHEEPYVPNYITNTKEVLLPGTVIAIEPMINLGTKKIMQMQDGWTIKTIDRKPSAHFEHTVAVTDNGPIIITKIK